MNTLGRHVLVEFFKCDSDILNEVTYIENSMVDAAKDAGATIINSSFHHFAPFGVSGVVVIQESHLAIHTWPEYGYAAVDLFTCGESVNPWVAFDYLKKAFKAENGSAMELLRGAKDLLKRTDFKMDVDQAYGEDTPDPKTSRNIWFTDRDENQALSLRHSGDLLYRKKTDYQTVEVFNTYGFGKMLAIDKMVMTTEKDEFIYHELITHIPMQAQPNMKKILVIGGGDGGTVREVLKYSSVESVDMVEIDEAVVEASKEHLPSIASALDHPKLNLVIGDGIDFVAKAQAESYDLIIVDGSDPVGPAEGLFSTKFYEDIHKALKTDGILVAQSESPFFNVEAFKEIFACHTGIFGKDNTACALAHIPTYPTGTWSFSICSKGDVNVKQSNPSAEKMNGLKYYSSEMHSAAFALPPFVKEMMP